MRGNNNDDDDETVEGKKRSVRRKRMIKGQSLRDDGRGTEKVEAEREGGQLARVWMAR